jgi:hypothetical protein
VGRDGEGYSLARRDSFNVTDRVTMLLGKVASGKTLLSMQIDVMAQDNPAGPNESGEISLISKTQRQRQQWRLLFDICGWSMTDERHSLRLDDGCYPHGNYLVSDGCCQGHAGITIQQPSLIEIKQKLVVFSWTAHRPDSTAMSIPMTSVTRQASFPNEHLQTD